MFDGIILAGSLIKADLQSLKAKITTLENCWLAAVPDDEEAQAQAYVDEINAAFGIAYPLWGIS